MLGVVVGRAGRRGTPGELYVGRERQVMDYKVLREREYAPPIPFDFALMIWAWIARDKCAQG